jgi:putative RNA 2'-phosphotransferase
MILNEKTTKSISKLLSLALRHHPESLEIQLDKNGWADVDSVLKGLNKKGYSIGLEGLQQVVETNSKKRFALNEDQTKIRANQGHSLEVDLELAPLSPPDYLYHGTSVDAVDEIRKKGIERRSRQYVHLSTDKETAKAVGSRHGVPFIFTVRSGAMHQDGHLFYKSENGVWLALEVPAKYLD